MELKNNTILISGGTSGIGLELGHSLRNMGNTVILLGRNKAKLKELSAEGYETICCNLLNIEDLEKAVLIIQNEYPNLNILFNNVGVQNNYNFTEAVSPFGKIKQEIGTNFTSQIQLTQLLIPVLATKEKSFIINTTSALGAYPKPDGLVYSATKAAMRNFTIGLRNTVKDVGIKVLELIPPVTDTSMTSKRDEKKMPVNDLIVKILPQLKKEKRVITIFPIRIFLNLAKIFPYIARKVI